MSTRWSSAQEADPSTCLSAGREQAVCPAVVVFGSQTVAAPPPVYPQCRSAFLASDSSRPIGNSPSQDACDNSGDDSAIATSCRTRRCKRTATQQVRELHKSRAVSTRKRQVMKIAGPLGRTWSWRA